MNSLFFLIPLALILGGILIITAVVLLLVGVGLGWWWMSGYTTAPRLVGMTAEEVIRQVRPHPHLGKTRMTESLPFREGYCQKVVGQ